MAYDQLGAGIASAGQSVAAGLQMREDRKWREKTFEEQKRQFEIGEANKVKAANMKAGADFLDQLGKGVEGGAYDPDAANQLAQFGLNSINTGEPLNFDAIARIQQAQRNLEQPEQAVAQPDFGQQQMQANIDTPFEAPEIPRQVGLAQTRPDTQSRISPLSTGYEPPKVFPTLYDRVSKVSSPKAVQVRALKPQEQIKLFREKPVNFDAAVKDGLQEGYVTPEHAGEYYEAKLLGKSDEELAAILKKMWRNKPLSEDEKSRAQQSRDNLKVQNLKDYLDYEKLANEMTVAASTLYNNYQQALAKLETDKVDPNSPVRGQLFDEYTKEKERIEKRITKLNQAKTNLGHFIEKAYNIDLDKIPNMREGQKFFEDRVKELTRRSLPAATIEQSIEEKEKARAQAEKEVLENFGFDIAKTRSPQPDLTEDERIDNEFDALLEANQRKTGDRNRAGLAAIAELLKKYPNNEMLKAAQVEITNRMRQ